MELSFSYRRWTKYPEEMAGSNYGAGVVDIWAPGDMIPLMATDGRTYLVGGTSYAAGYVTGILAIFYGIEGPCLTPTLARQRLMQQASDW